MTPNKWNLRRLVGGATALSAAVLLSATGPAAAQAIDQPQAAAGIGDLGDYAKGAYGAYQFLFEDKLTLEQAVAQIQNAVNAAKTEIIAEIDRLEADAIESCARTSVIDFADIEHMDTNRVQAFATSTTMCVTDAWSRIPNATDPAAVDQMSFALNIVGPIALFARSRAYGAEDAGTVQLRDSLIQANQTARDRLKPSCSATRGEVVNGRQEVTLSCVAFNGNHSNGRSIYVRAGQPLPTDIDYSDQITQAMAQTSFPVSIGALDGMLDDPVVASPGNQIGYYAAAVNLSLSASGAAPPYRWTVIGLPPGLSANPQGVITGTLSQVGTFTVAATATDTNAQFSQISFAWTVRDTPTVLPGPLGDRTTAVGTQVSVTPVATGGTPPFTWSVTGLPAGLSADATGKIAGTVRRSPYTNTVTVTVTDANAQHSSRTFTWTVTESTPVENANPYGSPIALAAGGDGRVEAFGTNTADGVYHTWEWTPGDPNSLAVWEQFDGQMRSVAAETNADGRIEVFGVNGAGQLFNKWQWNPGRDWSVGWNPFDGQVNSIALARNRDGRLELFATDDAGNIKHRWQSPTGWSAWAPIEGQLHQIAAQANGDGRIELVGTNFAGQIFHKVQTVANTNTWSDWAQLAGELRSITVAKNRDGRLEIFGANQAGVPYHSVETLANSDTWQRWEPLSGTVSQVAAETDANGNIELFGVNSAGLIYHRWQRTPGGDWTEWAQFGGKLRVTKPSVTVPSLIGLTPGQADAALDAAGLLSDGTAGTVTTDEPTLNGKISRQSIANGSTVAPGTHVSYWIGSYQPVTCGPIAC